MTRFKEFGDVWLKDFLGDDSHSYLRILDQQYLNDCEKLNFMIQTEKNQYFFEMVDDQQKGRINCRVKDGQNYQDIHGGVFKKETWDKIIQRIAKNELKMFENLDMTINLTVDNETAKKIIDNLKEKFGDIVEDETDRDPL